MRVHGALSYIGVGIRRRPVGLFSGNIAPHDLPDCSHPIDLQGV